MAFAAGWTPCLGTIFGGILAIAATQSAARGAFLLFVYSVGIGIPFVLLGVGVQWLTGTLGWIKRHYRAITAVSGVLLIAVGVLIATGSFTRIVAPLLRFAPGLYGPSPSRPPGVASGRPHGLPAPAPRAPPLRCARLADPPFDADGARSSSCS